MARFIWIEADWLFIHLLAFQPIESFTTQPPCCRSLHSPRAPPCRSFFPLLCSFLSSQTNPPPVLLLPSDTSPEEYSHHLKLAPYGSYTVGFESGAESELSNIFEIEDVPSLVLLKGGKVVTTNATARLTTEPESYPWPTISMVEAFSTDDSPICVLFEESCSQGECEAFTEFAREKMGGDWKFVRVRKDAGLSAQIGEQANEEPIATETSEEDEAVASLRHFLTRTYDAALSSRAKIVAVSGSRRQAWGFGWSGDEEGREEVTVEGAGAWLNGIEKGTVKEVTATTLSDSEESGSEEDDNDSDWEEDDSDAEYSDEEDEEDEEAINAQLEMLMGMAGGDREAQLRGLIAVLGSEAGGAVGMEELLSGMRAARIEEIGDQEEEEQLSQEQIGELQGSSTSASEGEEKGKVDADDVKGKRVNR
jgi:hypothetical protein